jgi:hypothetical protein
MGVEFWVLTSPILSGLAAHGYTGINSSLAANTADSSSVFDECRDPDPSALTKPARHTLENLDHHGDVAHIAHRLTRNISAKCGST